MPSALQIVWESLPQVQRARALKKKQPLPKYPFRQQGQYATLTTSIVAKIEADTKDILNQRLPEIWNAANPELSRRDADWGLTLSALYGMIESGFADQEQSYRAVERIAIGVEEVDAENWARFTRSMVGIALASSEEWIEPMRGVWVSQGVDLIKSLEDDLLRSVKLTVNAGIAGGKRHESIAEELYGEKGVFEKAKNRAKFIARDQVAKYNGQLWRKRIVDAGIMLYVWRDSKDERVRHTHNANAGRVFSWDNPPSNGTGHPTEDYQCRCHAEAVMLFEMSRDEIDSVIGANESILTEYYQRETGIAA